MRYPIAKLNTLADLQRDVGMEVDHIGEHIEDWRSAGKVWVGLFARKVSQRLDPLLSEATEIDHEVLLRYSTQTAAILSQRCRLVIGDRTIQLGPGRNEGETNEYIRCDGLERITTV